MTTTPPQEAASATADPGPDFDFHCPSWCAVDPAKHREEWHSWGEAALHDADLLFGPYGQGEGATSTVYIAGMGDADDAYRVHADIHPDKCITSAQARVIGAAFLAAADALDGDAR